MTAHVLRISSQAFPPLWALILALACQAAMLTSAQSQSVAAGQATADLYSATIAEALRESQLGHFPEAYALFERAHALFPNARALRGIGVCAFEIRDYPRAWTALRAALEHRVQPLTPEQRADVQALIERTSIFLARLELVGVPADGIVRVDGSEAIVDDGVVLLSAGRHLITIEIGGARTFQQSVDAVGRSRQRMFVGGGSDTMVGREISRGASSNDAPEVHVERQTFRIRVTSTQPQLTLLRNQGAAFVRAGSVPSAVRLDRLCTAPCEITLVRGHHRFVVEDSTGRLHSLPGPTLVEAEGELTMEIVSRRRERRRGYILAVSSLAIAMPLIAIGASNNRDRDASCCDRVWPLAGPGVALAVLGISSVGFAASAHDRPRLTFARSHDGEAARALASARRRSTGSR